MPQWSHDPHQTTIRSGNIPYNMQFSHRPIFFIDQQRGKPQTVGQPTKSHWLINRHIAQIIAKNPKGPVDATLRLQMRFGLTPGTNASMERPIYPRQN